MWQKIRATDSFASFHDFYPYSTLPRIPPSEGYINPTVGGYLLHKLYVYKVLYKIFLSQ